MNAPNLTDKLKAVYRALKPGVDYTLSQDGASLATWTPRQAGLNQPSLAMVDSAYAAIVKNQGGHTIATADFIARIPVATWAKVQTARATNPALDQGIARLIAGPVVDAADADLLAALAGLVTAGVITAEERTQILNF